MSRATAAPSAGSTSVATRAAAPAAPVTSPTTAPVPSVPSTANLRRPAAGAVQSALEGTPGRMRLFGFLGALAAAIFGVVGAMSLWSSANALERADHNTAQVVRIQGIYADLVRADSTATSAFLVGGLENGAQRADYDASMTRVATGIVAAAQAQPADADALGALNSKVQSYAATVEEARVYNRQGLPIGAQYLSTASDSLRSETLPIVQALITANTERANAEFDAASNLWRILLPGLLALAVLVLVMVWLARRTHRYLNPSIGLGALLVTAALVLGAVTLGGVGRQVQDVRTADFANTVAFANSRSAAYDAKSNESLTLIKRGSGGDYEKAWQKQSNIVGSLPIKVPDRDTLQKYWNAYVDAHKAIRALDDGGKWNDAVQAAGKTDPGSATQLFNTFDARITADLDQGRAAMQSALLSPVGWVTILGWLLLVLCVAAALLVIRGMGQRIEEYR